MFLLCFYSFYGQITGKLRANYIKISRFFWHKRKNVKRNLVFFVLSVPVLPPFFLRCDSAVTPLFIGLSPTLVRSYIGAALESVRT